VTTLVLVLIVITVIYVLRRQSVKKPSPLGIDGEVIYADKGRNSHRFVNHKYGISAKPDFIIRTANAENVMVEYKSRMNRIYLSDIVQLKASVLAARAHMPIHRAVIVTKGDRQNITLGSDAQLYSEIAQYVELARRAQGGEIIKIFAAHKGICRSCSVAHSCQRR
jgi:CRISPR/Cas system-associated exonuclease Cas4 (RecB family)